MVKAVKELQSTQERPFVTFALFAYNQQKYIRSAIDGALNQTYEPLEIIISDDCSTDNTYEVIEQAVADYKGPHRIKINKNKKNLGVVKHVHLIHKLASGEYVIHAGGDDISHPNRTETFINSFNSFGVRPSIIMSRGRCIDESGSLILDEGANDYPCGGASLALHRELIDIFPEPVGGIHAEDVLLASRALKVNGIKYIKDVLIDYRILKNSLSLGGTFRNYSPKEIHEKNVVGCNSALAMIKQELIDIKSINFSNADYTQKNLEKKLHQASLSIKMLTSPFIKSTLYLIEGCFRRGGVSMVKMYLVRWLPILLEFKKKIRNIRG